MTRKTLRARLTGTYVLIGLVLIVAAGARFLYPMFDDGTTEHKALLATYEYLRDMSLLIATGGVAYLTNMYQRRSSFVDSLKEEWRDILHAKSALLEFTLIEAPSHQQYIAAFNSLSETIDNMRTVYRNVGETRELVGLYPYAPLHDMRRALQTLNPLKSEGKPPNSKLVRDAILQSFYALRERFLDELDLEEPTNPVLIFGGRRRKKSGSTGAADGLEQRQRKRQAKLPGGDPEIGRLLTELYDREQATPKPWRDAAPAREMVKGGADGNAGG